MFSLLYFSRACGRRCGRRYILRASDINQSRDRIFARLGPAIFRRRKLHLPSETCPARARVCESVKEEIPKKLRGGRISRQRGINQRGSTLSRFFYTDSHSGRAEVLRVHRRVHKEKGEETVARYDSLRNSAGVGAGYLLHKDIN